MMLRFTLAIMACYFTAACGCVSPVKPITPEQRAAIETRPVDGTREDVLRAAAAVMLDEGFIFTMSDHAAGLIAGERLADPMYAASYARNGGLGESRNLYVSRTVVWVRSRTPTSSDLRIQLLVNDLQLQLQGGNGEVASEQHTQAIWTKVQQRLLAYLPAPKGAAP